MQKKDRTYRMYLDDILISIKRISEYIGDYSFIDFKQDYEIIWDIATNYLPENQTQIETILKKEK